MFQYTGLIRIENKMIQNYNNNDDNDDNNNDYDKNDDYDNNDSCTSSTQYLFSFRIRLVQV